MAYGSLTVAGGETWKNVFYYTSAPPTAYVTLDSPIDFSWKVAGAGIPFTMAGQSRNGHADVYIGWTGGFCAISVLTSPANSVTAQFHGFPGT
jgi:hypothetical protein